MKAICVTEARALELREVPEPREADLPGDHLLVEMEASAINHGDKMFLGRPATTSGLNTSLHNIWGASGAGRVLAAGANLPSDLSGRKVAIYPLHAKPDATGKEAGEREFRNSLTQCLDGILAEEETMPTVSKGGFVENIVIVTGASSGLGKAFAVALLQAGYQVVGTVRQEKAAHEFDQLKPGAAFARVLDVTDAPDRLAATVAEIERNVGPIYALINNAGYGHEGTLEESSMEDLRRQFEINVFGAVAMMKAVLPFMRSRRKGRILNVTSMGGLMTMPGLSYYHGSKFALEGISSSLAKEVRSLGIFVTAVEPGMFRTDWAGRSMVRSERTIPDYDAMFNPIREARKARSGRQPGDPAKAGKAIAEFLTAPEPPLHLLLGPDAFELVNKELETLRAEFAAWEKVARSTNLDEVA